MQPRIDAQDAQHSAIRQSGLTTTLRLKGTQAIHRQVAQQADNLSSEKASVKVLTPHRLQQRGSTSLVRAFQMMEIVLLAERRSRWHFTTRAGQSVRTRANGVRSKRHPVPNLGGENSPTKVRTVVADPRGERQSPVRTRSC